MPRCMMGAVAAWGLCSTVIMGLWKRKRFGNGCWRVLECYANVCVTSFEKKERFTLCTSVASSSAAFSPATARCCGLAVPPESCSRPLKISEWMCISLHTLVDIHARAQAVKAGKSQALKRQERHVMLALESCASSSLFSSFMSDLKKGDEA